MFKIFLLCHNGTCLISALYWENCECIVVKPVGHVHCYNWNYLPCWLLKSSPFPYASLVVVECSIQWKCRMWKVNCRDMNVLMFGLFEETYLVLIPLRRSPILPRLIYKYTYSRDTLCNLTYILALYWTRFTTDRYFYLYLLNSPTIYMI